MNYLIRPAEPQDIAAIIELCAKHAEYEKATYSPEGKAEKLSSFIFTPNPRLFCLVAEINQSVVGYSTYMKEFSTWDADFYIHIDCLYLKPEARSLGIGEELVRAIANHTQSLGVTQIQWQTPDFNERAIKFYHRIGAQSKPKLRMFLNPAALLHDN